MMKITYTFSGLCLSMQTRSHVMLTGSDGRTFCGIINGIAPEDGSGHSWLITLTLTVGERTIHVRTVS